MHVKTASLAIACALVLAACGDKSPPAEPASAPAPAPDAPATTPPPVTEPAAPAAQTPAPAMAPDAGAPAAVDTGTAPADGRMEAVVSNCSTSIEGNDAMQFSVGSITVPSSCSEFTINLKHTGRLPVAAMGHNVVIALASDRQGIASDGATSSVDAGYLKAGDARVIAHSELVGGGGSTSVTFPVSAIKGAGPYEFFCSFPGHWAVMRGPIKVG